MAVEKPSNPLGLHGAAAFQRAAPSPGQLPPPPPRWVKSSSLLASSAPRSSDINTDVDNSRDGDELGQQADSGNSSADATQSETALGYLQGTLLHAKISPLLPELAGKITGMILELDADEIAESLGDTRKLQSLVDEALAVLKQSGDPRALCIACGPALLSPPRSPPAAPARTPAKLPAEVPAEGPEAPATPLSTPPRATLPPNVSAVATAALLEALCVTPASMASSMASPKTTPSMPVMPAVPMCCR